MKKDIFLLAVLLIATVASMRVSAQTVGPNMTEFGGYGYLLNTSNAADLWWAEATYKVMKDAPLPSRKADVTIKCARCQQDRQRLLHAQASDTGFRAGRIQPERVCAG